jgi:hypothetical protein
MSSVEKQLEELQAVCRPLQSRVEHLEQKYVEKMTEIRAFALRVRRDILIYELYMRSQHGDQFQRFLEEGHHGQPWNLSKDMSAEDAAEMNELLRQLLDRMAPPGDPGDAPLPPFL